MRTTKYVEDANLARKAAIWLEGIRGKVALRPEFELQQGRAALIVIDMMRYFASSDGRCFLPASSAIIGSIATLVESWRRYGMPVVYTQHCHSGPDDLGMLGKFFSDYIKDGEPDSSIVKELEPRAGELVVKKNTYDAFLGTGLEDSLRKLGVDQVVITGVLTHMCCETTARAAFCRGFEVYVPVDALASSDEERHLGSLLSMADSVAIMTRTQEVLECLEADK